eukprot:3060896-Amphidinium_carterae.1
MHKSLTDISHEKHISKWSEQRLRDGIAGRFKKLPYTLTEDETKPCRCFPQIGNQGLVRACSLFLKALQNMLNIETVLEYKLLAERQLETNKLGV